MSTKKQRLLSTKVNRSNQTKQPLKTSTFSLRICIIHNSSLLLLCDERPTWDDGEVFKPNGLQSLSDHLRDLWNLEKHDKTSRSSQPPAISPSTSRIFVFQNPEPCSCHAPSDYNSPSCVTLLYWSPSPVTPVFKLLTPLTFLSGLLS